MSESQPELFSLDPPPAAKPVCGQCGSEAVVVRYGVPVCTICGAGASQAAAAERVEAMKARGRAKHVQASRRRRRR